LDDNQRGLICNCLDEDIIENDLTAPTSEEQLRDLQKVVDACDLISVFQEKAGTQKPWLTDEGKEFPNAVRRYFHHAASQFHSQDKKLPDKFAVRLRKFVRDCRPHIATLNYDDLLYNAFTETDIFAQHMLRDGFFGQFDFQKHKELYNRKKEGWFLHLHGSPLFITRAGAERKIKRSELSEHKGSEKTHLVLTHAKSKPNAIQSSAILTAYWNQLSKILKSECEITLFGYSGNDLHLNRLIAENGDQLRLRIVARKPEDQSKTMESWREHFRGVHIEDENFVFENNILGFDQW
jgi:hypothetical protein